MITLIYFSGVIGACYISYEIGYDRGFCKRIKDTEKALKLADDMALVADRFKNIIEEIMILSRKP